jgi:hypothetical protein
MVYSAINYLKRENKLKKKGKQGYVICQLQQVLLPTKTALYTCTNIYNTRQRKGGELV